MRIAQVSPLYESVPPQLYGGTERIVSFLTEELVAMGHEVTLFASGDSITSATLIPCSPRGLRLDSGCRDPLPYHMLMLERVMEMVDNFDVVHFHIDYLHYPTSARLCFNHVTTLHGRLDIPDLVPLYRTFSRVPVVSISDSQRTPLPWLNWQATVHHGLPSDLLPSRQGAGGYLAFLGRVSPEKGLKSAIEIARGCSTPLRIAAKVDPTDKEYFEELSPLIDGKQVEWVGEIGEREKGAFLGGARALLFPIDWEEPFGLVMIEAMSCGTPVIACPRGSVPEIVTHGISGFIIGNVQEGVQAVKNVESLDRRMIRREFEDRFLSERMARGYLAIYEQLAAKRCGDVGTSISEAAQEQCLQHNGADAALAGR